LQLISEARRKPTCRLQNRRHTLSAQSINQGSTFEGEVITFRQKPNPFLYSLEATRIWILFLLGLSLVQIVVLHLARGAPLIFMVELTFLIDCVMFAIFIVAVILIALGVEFIVTNKRVVIQVYARVRLTIPVEDIKGIEVRCYGQQYGSVYLDRYNDAYEKLPHRPIDLTKKRGWASIWFVLPWSLPPLTGFYGFRNYELFELSILDAVQVPAAASFQTHPPQ
jgi:hypothetical protein